MNDNINEKSSGIMSKAQYEYLHSLLSKMSNKQLKMMLTSNKTGKTLLNTFVQQYISYYQNNEQLYNELLEHKYLIIHYIQVYANKQLPDRQHLKQNKKGQITFGIIGDQNAYLNSILVNWEIEQLNVLITDNSVLNKFLNNYINQFQIKQEIFDQLQLNRDGLGYSVIAIAQKTKDCKCQKMIINELTNKFSKSDRSSIQNMLKNKSFVIKDLDLLCDLDPNAFEYFQSQSLITQSRLIQISLTNALSILSDMETNTKKEFLLK